MNVDRKTVLAGGVGAGVGILVPVAMERFLPQFWNADPIIQGQSWSQKKIILPLGIGAGLMAVGYFVKDKNESAGAFSFVAGAVMLVKGLFDLINVFLVPQARANLNMQHRFVPPPRPMHSVEVGRTTSQFTPRPNRTSEETKTKIVNRTIWA